MKTATHPAEDFSLSAIPRPSAKQLIVDQIRSAIMQGKLKPGQRLTEPNLAATLGVGQATIREALIELEHMGFVQRAKPRKTFVTKLTVPEIEQLYAVRIPLELAALDLLAASPSKPDLQKAEDYYKEMLAAALESDLPTFRRADLEFHRSLWAATGNSFLADALERLVVRLFAFALMFVGKVHSSSQDLVALAEQHGTLLRLLEKGDVAGAKQVMIASMDRSWMKELETSGDLS